MIFLKCGMVHGVSVEGVGKSVSCGIEKGDMERGVRKCWGRCGKGCWDVGEVKGVVGRGVGKCVGVWGTVGGGVGKCVGVYGR